MFYHILLGYATTKMCSIEKQVLIKKQKIRMQTKGLQLTMPIMNYS
jgi:hypothetical protein